MNKKENVVNEGLGSAGKIHHEVMLVHTFKSIGKLNVSNEYHSVSSTKSY